jgi:outer membrane protein assembly factor BamB
LLELQAFGMVARVDFLPVILLAVLNWPQFRGPDGQGHADNARLPVAWAAHSNVTWRTELPGKGWSSPVIWSNQIWMTTATEEGRSLRALCVDKTNGKLLRDVEVFRREKPLVIHDKNSHASPTPVIEDGRVYVNFGTAGTACLATDTGTVLWRSTELQLEHLVGPGSSPILYKDLLVLTCDGTNTQFVAALEKKTGKLAWKTKRSGTLRDNPDFQKAFSTPLLVADQLISPGADWVYGYEPQTGKELWRAGYHGFSTVTRPVVGHGLFWICSGFGDTQLYAFRLGGKGDCTATHSAWKLSKNAPAKPSPILVGNELYGVSDLGSVACLDARTGQEIWRSRLTGNFSASPIVADGKLYFCSEEGKVTVLEAGKEFKKLAQNALGERIMASPAVTGNTLFLRTDKALYRIEEAKR